MRVLKFLSVFVFFSYHSLSQAQEIKTTTSEELFCKNKDYQFLMEDNHYFHNKKAYVCSSQIPINIVVIDVDSQLPVNESFTWTVNGNLSTESSHTISIVNVDFIDDKLVLKAEFLDPLTDKIVSLRLRLFKDIALLFEESASNYQYDDNKKQAYIDEVGYGENIGTPWNFVENGKMEILQATMSKKKGFYVNSEITANSSDLSISPDEILTTPADVSFDYQGSGQTNIEVSGCNDMYAELLLFSDSQKSFGIEFFELCDTDDDQQLIAVGTTGLSPDAVCVDGGQDLTIDEMYAVNSSGVNVIKAAGDRLVKNQNNKYFVLAGDNGVCDWEANQPGKDVCPYSFDVEASMTIVNSTFGKISISATSTGVSLLRFNYDLVSDDGILEVFEYQELYNHRLATGDFDDGYHEVYLVRDLPASLNTKTLGTSYLDTPTSVINTKEAVNSTLAHEIGHAKYGFGHPGDLPEKRGFNVVDPSNYMFFTAVGRTMNIRRYQFEKMHNKN